MKWYERHRLILQIEAVITDEMVHLVLQSLLIQSMAGLDTLFVAGRKETSIRR
jgi:hypothetical protein